MISSTQALTSATLAGGNNEAVPISWTFLLNADIAVLRTRAGVDSLLVLNTDYTVSGGGQTTGLPATGTVTVLLTTAADIITVYRDVPETQILQLTTLTNLPAKSLETNYDRIVMQLQTMTNKLDRTVFMPMSSAVTPALGSATARANLFLGFDSSGQPTLLASSVAVSATKSIVSAAGVVSLVNDATTPGNSMMYGTNGAGTRGWYAQPVTGTGSVTSIADGATAGVSWTIANRTTTPVFTFALGAITPTSVVTGTLSATGLISNTSTSGIRTTSNGITSIIGNDGSVAVFGTTTAHSSAVWVNSAIIGTFSSTGLSVTGTLSATGGVTSTNSANSAGQVALLLQNANGNSGIGSRLSWRLDNLAYEWGYINVNRVGGGSTAQMDIAVNGSAYVGAPSVVGTFSSTGLAVTGTLSATGNFDGVVGGFSSATADSQLKIGTVGPSVKLVNNYATPNSSTKGAIFAMATVAAHYGLADGDIVLGGLGDSRGDMYIKPNYSGTGTKGLFIYGNTAVTGNITASTYLFGAYGYYNGPIAAYNASAGAVYLGFAGGAGIVRSVVDNSGNTAPLQMQCGNGTVIGTFSSTGIVVTGSNSTTSAHDFGFGTGSRLQMFSGNHASFPSTYFLDANTHNFRTGPGVAIGNLTSTGFALSVAPTVGGHLCNKTYVDAVASGGLKVHVACRLATNAALPTYTGTGTNVLTASANGILSVDGVVVVVADRILLKNGAATQDNGVYDVTTVGTAGTAYVLTRSALEDTAAEMPLNAYFLITAGTLTNTAWVVSTTPATMNTNPLLWAQYTQSSAYLAGTGIILTGSTFSADTTILMQKASNLSDVASTITAKTNLKIIGVNVLDYGADNTGLSDSTTAFTNAIAACAPTGGITNVILNTNISGYGVPADNWTGRPAITAGGGLSGSTGFAAVGNINSNGYLSSVEITTIGTGYDVLNYLINRTSGSPVITIGSGTFDARIVSGSTVSVRHESVTTSCRVVTRDSSTQLTLSENMTYTNQDQFVFGMPYLILAGTPDYTRLVPIVGAGKTLVIPPGTYLCPNGIGNIGGMSNLTIEASGANIAGNSVTGGVGFSIRNSTGITWNGGTIRFRGARYWIPSTPGRSTRYPGQSGIAIDCSSQVVVRNLDIYDAMMFGAVVGGGSTANTFISQRVHLDGMKIVNSLGDGIHVTTGAQYVRVSSCWILHPGDDALATVGDGSSTINRPNDILFEDCIVEGGTYRGCVAITSDNVIFRSISGKNTHGPFCWAAADGTTAPTNVTFEDIKAYDLGNTAITPYDGNSGVGIYANTVTGLVVRDLNFTRHSTASANTNDIYSVYESTITDLDSDQQQLSSTGNTVGLTGSVNTDLDCYRNIPGADFAIVTLTPGRWMLSGSITVRFAAGPGGQMWPVLHDGTTEYGSGATFQTADQGLRQSILVTAFINVISGTKLVRFKVKQGGAGVQIDAGSPTAGPNSYLTACRI